MDLHGTDGCFTFFARKIVTFQSRLFPEGDSIIDRYVHFLYEAYPALEKSQFPANISTAGCWLFLRFAIHLQIHLSYQLFNMFHRLLKFLRYLLYGLSFFQFDLNQFH